MAVTLKFLPETAVSTAESAITELNFGNIIRGNSKIMGLKIGNTGDSIAESVTLRIEGGDAAAGWKTISVNAQSSWETEAMLPNIAATNGISDKVYIKSTVPAGATTGLHTSSLRVEYIYI